MTTSTATMNTTRAAACALLIASSAAIAAGAPKGQARTEPRSGVPRYGMVVYSDLCVNPQSGEFGGQRITLQRFAEVDTVIYEYTAGGLSWPIVASDVNVDPRGKMMYFTVQPAEGEERTISGKFSPDGATLTLDGGYCGDETVPMKLAKMRDFGRKAGACRPCPASRSKPAAEPQGEEVKQEGETPLPPEQPAPAPKWEPAPPSQG
jgi:hypothetical protein